jgi:excisionase family DNA binding protein
MRTTNHEPEVLTVEEAAERLRFSTKTILTWIKQGKLPAHRIGSGKGARWRIPAAAVARLMRAEEPPREAGA